MRITTAWIKDDGFHLLSAYSDDDFETWGKVPDWYVTDTANQDSTVRQMVVEVPDSALECLFGRMVTQGTVVES